MSVVVKLLQVPIVLRANSHVPFQVVNPTLLSCGQEIPELLPVDVFLKDTLQPFLRVLVS